MSWVPPVRGRRGGSGFAQTVAGPVAAFFPEPLVLAGAAAGAAVELRAPSARAPRDGWSAERRRRFRTRFLPTLVAVAVAGAAPWLLPEISGLRSAALAPAGPSILAPSAVGKVPSLLPGLEGDGPAAPQAPAAERPQAADPMPAIEWRASRAIGVPHSGRLVRGVGLPVEGPGWVTWDPALDRSPNRERRLYGTDTLVRALLGVVAAYRAAHPDAPALVIGDLSHEGGGPIDEHVSHQNGLDVDIYYPRRDGRLRPPSRVAQIDLALAQDLVDRFREAGAQIMFVGPSTGLRGPAGVVVPYPNHDDHVHVRFARPS